MKHFSRYLTSTLLLIMTFAACRRDNTYYDDHTALQQLSNSWKKEAKTYLVDASRDTQIVAEKGTVITLPAGNFLDADGNPVLTGTVQLALIELYGLTDYILQKNTAVTTDGRAFISGGQVMLEATAEDGQKLRSSGYHLAFKQDEAKLDEDLPMYYFYAAPTMDDGWIRWDASTAAGETLPQNDEFGGLVPDTVKDFYYVFESLQYFDWINCDQYVDGEGTKDLKARMAMEGFNLSNANVMFLLPEINSLVPATTYLGDEGIFAELGIEIPEGTQVQVLMFGYLDGALYYVLTPPKAYTSGLIIDGTPSVGTEEGLLTIINAVE